MYAAAVLVGVVLAIAPAQSASLSSRIANGYPASPGQFPYQVLLLGSTANGGSLICGGSILSADWVVTAAHCCNGVVKFTMHLGAYNFANSGEPDRLVVSSSEIIVHEQYDPAILKNDIAVIRAARRIVFTVKIQPIKLPTAGASFDGKTAIASGWGVKASGDNTPAQVLQFGVFRLISNANCSNYFGGIINSGSQCAQGVDLESICFGDSGGPLVLKDTNTLVGVSSFVSGYTLCSAATPNGFARVSSYVGWITQKTAVGP